jgi:hypothetical protein
MEGRRDLSLRRLSHRYEPHRLEEQVWALAYEQIWPSLRRAVNSPRSASQVESVRKANETFATVRSA